MVKGENNNSYENTEISTIYDFLEREINNGGGITIYKESEIVKGDQLRNHSNSGLCRFSICLVSDGTNHERDKGKNETKTTDIYSIDYLTNTEASYYREIEKTNLYK